MKLIKQEKLYFKDDRSDKVYEVDLCEVDGDLYLVNFRYGRRGTTLREGTKTTAVVSRDKAEQIFQRLVDSKRSKGYQILDGEEPLLEEDARSSSPEKENWSPVERGIINRLKKGKVYSGNWKLSRAIWRAGEIGFSDAEPFLHRFSDSEPMTVYCIAWAMGRFGLENSVSFLRELIESAGEQYVKHIAIEALRLTLPEQERQDLITQRIHSLPQPLEKLLVSGSEEAFQSEFSSGLGKKYKPSLLTDLYFIDSPVPRKALLQALRTVGLDPPFFRIIRRIFKTAEMRGDGQVFGYLAYRFEKYKCKIRIPSWTWHGYQKPTLGANPQHAFSVQTRDYFRRRVWNTLKRLGEAGHDSFVPMAVGTLLPFTDDDAKPVRTDHRYHYDYKLRQGHSETIQWDIFGGYWAFNQLLYRNSVRYVPLRGKKSFRLAANHQPGCPAPQESEEAFADLWIAQPRGLVHLLTESKCRPVHDFAVKAIRKCPKFLQELPIDVIKILISSGYESTMELGLEMAVSRFDKANLDSDLVLALANCRLDRARSQAKLWMVAHRQTFFKDIGFVYEVLTSNYSDIRSVGMEQLFSIPSDETALKVLTGRLVAFLQSAKDDEKEIAASVGSVLLQKFFQPFVSNLGENVLCDLLSNKLIEVQSFVGSVVLNHSRFSQAPTERILDLLIRASHPSVREIGIQLVSNLPEKQLKNNIDFLSELCCHQFEDVRKEIRPIVKRLIDQDREFSQQFSLTLVRKLLIPGAPEGVPTHISRLLREDFSDQLDHIVPETVFDLLHSKSSPAQEVGGFLLSRNVDPNSVSISQIVRLASHDVLAVRQSVWRMYEDNVHRMQEELAGSIRIVDAKWEDSRRFGFQFLKQKLDHSLLTPDVLISLCDSVREDVQQFAKEMITRRFESEHGAEYLVKLSEHPTASMQLFASNFLIEYGSDDSEKMKQMAPYFVSILSRVNKSRVAKDRVLAFLKSEATNNKTSAKTIGRIFDRISATCAIQDRAASIEAMVALNESHPEIDLPIKLKNQEVR